MPSIIAKQLYVSQIFSVWYMAVNLANTEWYLNLTYAVLDSQIIDY